MVFSEFILIFDFHCFSSYLCYWSRFICLMCSEPNSETLRFAAVHACVLSCFTHVWHIATPGIFQARILEWVTIPSSRGSSRPRDQIHFSCFAYIQAYSLPLSYQGSLKFAAEKGFIHKADEWGDRRTTLKSTSLKVRGLEHSWVKLRSEKCGESWLETRKRKGDHPSMQEQLS